jgi:hypothetical protein
VLKLFEKPVPGTGLDVVLPPQFQSRPQGMFRVTQRGERLSETQLCNYRASIKANVRLDDGVETKREFEMESELLGRSFQFTIPASEFARMDWPIAQMGSGAITFPNQREYARTAIQSFSMAADERCIYTHTGWRNIDDRWLFLHAAGAIGAAGPVSDVQVRLPGLLGRYELRASSEPDALVSAIRASLWLAKLAPPSISFPLLAATYRAVIGGADFAIHVAGEPGLDEDVDVVPFECRKGVFEADAEFTDHDVGVRELLLIFVLGEVIVLDTSAKIANVPVARVVVEDPDILGLGECLFVKRVGDYLAQRMVNFPVFQNFFDVQVELFHGSPPLLFG